jgi:hypothetical protein
MPSGGCRELVLRIAVSSFQGVIEANDLRLECGDARGDTLPTIEDQRHSTARDAEGAGINRKDTPV